MIRKSLRILVYKNSWFKTQLKSLDTLNIPYQDATMKAILLKLGDSESSTLLASFSEQDGQDAMFHLFRRKKC